MWCDVLFSFSIQKPRSKQRRLGKSLLMKCGWLKHICKYFHSCFMFKSNHACVVIKIFIHIIHTFIRSFLSSRESHLKTELISNILHIIICLCYFVMFLSTFEMFFLFLLFLFVLSLSLLVQEVFKMYQLPLEKNIQVHLDICTRGSLNCTLDANSLINVKCLFWLLLDFIFLCVSFSYFWEKYLTSKETKRTNNLSSNYTVNIWRKSGSTWEQIHELFVYI